MIFFFLQLFETWPAWKDNSNCSSRLLEMLKSIFTDPAVYKASVDCLNITFTARRSKFGGKIPKAVVDGKTLPGKIQIKVTLCYCMSVIHCSL